MQVQKSIADVETNNLLQKYDEVIYRNLIENLNGELMKVKDKIEQTRIRIKELGQEKKWLNWVDKYGEKVGGLDDYSDAQKKEYLEGIITEINVSLDKTTKDHHLDIVFRLPLVDDDYKVIDKKSSPRKYKIIEGSKNKDTVIPYEFVRMNAKNKRLLGRQMQLENSKKKQNLLTP